MNQQRLRTQEGFNTLTDREKQVQASFWAQNFLIAELASANRLLRNLLVEKGVFTPEEDQALANDIVNGEILREMYDHTEKAFYDKYQRVRYAMENPQAVEEYVKNKMEGEDDE